MTDDELAASLFAFIKDSYPNMQVKVQPWVGDKSRKAVYFTEEKFALIYPMQRYHYLNHLIPFSFQEAELSNSIWFELAPGEKPEDLVYPDEQLISEISPFVMGILEKTGFFTTLDELFLPLAIDASPAQCWGDYRVSKSILPNKGFNESEYFDVFHVLMDKGGFCDCEILYNVVPESRYAKKYWSNRGSH
jgi:hypothetical protein